MTHREKILFLKDTIYFLYSKEGRSKKYISELLKLNRKTLTEIINNEWELVPAENKTNHLTPSKQKFINKNREYIENQIQSNIPIVQIAKKLNVTSKMFYNFLERDKELNTFYKNYKLQKENLKNFKKTEKENKINKKYEIEYLENEIWKKILGYEEYEVSNYGRLRKKDKNNKYFLIKSTPNVRNGRLYVRLKDKNLQVSRIVGHAFLEKDYKPGYTIEHIDNNVQNNKVENLKWVSQSENNKLAYQKGRKVNKNNHKIKEIILDDKYRFKTIIALSKFLNKSETQVRRYIDKECYFDRKITILY